MKNGFAIYLVVFIGAIIAIGSGVALGYLQKQSSVSVKETISQNPISQAAVVVDRIDVDGQFRRSRDTQRKADLLSITNVVYQYAAENDGVLPGDADFPTTPTCIGTNPECFDLASAGAIVPTYMAKMPYDPSIGSLGNTKYSIYVNNNGRVVATAVGEMTPEISITR